MDLCKPATAILLVSIAGCLYHLLAGQFSVVIWWLVVGVLGTGTFEVMCRGGLENLAWGLMSIPVLIVCFFLAVALFAARMRIETVKEVPCDRCGRPKHNCGCEGFKPVDGKKPATVLDMKGVSLQMDLKQKEKKNKLSAGKAGKSGKTGKTIKAMVKEGFVSYEAALSKSRGHDCGPQFCSCPDGETTCLTCDTGDSVTCGGSGCPYCSFAAVEMQTEKASSAGVDEILEALRHVLDIKSPVLPG